MLRMIAIRLAVPLMALAAGCSRPADSAPASSAADIRPAPTTDHDHAPSAHGGTLISIGKDNYHAEAVFEAGGVLKLYLLGADATKVFEVENQTLAALVKVGGVAESLPFELKPAPQSGDAPGKTSLFAGSLPAAAVGRPVIVTIPSLLIGTERYRVAFNSAEVHANAAMPAKLGTEEERKLFLSPGGAYTAADIAANGSTIPAVKFKGIKAEHDDNPKPGDKLCPISKTKANPKFAWIIGGKSYEFCCTPCIEEFVALAKDKPGEVKDPSEFVKK
jgi:hypothetical protein